jgi:hypothetical protein
MWLMILEGYCQNDFFFFNIKFVSVIMRRNKKKHIKRINFEIIATFLINLVFRKIHLI